MITFDRCTIGTNGKPVFVNTTAYGHNNQSLGYNLRENTFQERMILCMRQLGLSQRQLYKKLNELRIVYGYDKNDHVTFSQSLINNYYHGICVPKPSRMRFLAKFFGVSEYWLEGSGNLDAELYGRMPKFDPNNGSPTGYQIVSGRPPRFIHNPDNNNAA